MLLNLLFFILQVTVSPDLLSKVLEQSPLIILMCIIGYIMWSYIKEKNKIIKEKDEQILTTQKELMVLYGRAVESQSKLTNVIEELRKDFERNKL